MAEEARSVELEPTQLTALPLNLLCAHGFLLPSVTPPQAGQTATQLAAPKSTGKGKKTAAEAAAAALSDDGRSAMALVEAVAADLPELDKDR